MRISGPSSSSPSWTRSSRSPIRGTRRSRGCSREAHLETELVLELPNDPRVIEHAVEYVVQRCGPCQGRERKLRLNFRVGLTEALSNAMINGNEEDPRKRVRLEVFLEDDRIMVRVTDEGEGFDPGDVPDPTSPKNLLKS